MFRLMALVGVALLSPSVSRPADDKKEPAPRSVADDAAYLAANSGKLGWTSPAVTVKRGTEENKGKLVLNFLADKGKPTGSVALGIEFDDGAAISEKRGYHVFEVVEKDGKRSIEVYKSKQKEVLKDGVVVTENTREKEPSMILAYSIKDGAWSLNSTTKVERSWVTHEVNLGETIAFKPGK